MLASQILKYEQEMKEEIMAVCIDYHSMARIIENFQAITGLTVGGIHLDFVESMTLGKEHKETRFSGISIDRERV